MSEIRFKAKPIMIGSWTIVRLPMSASKKLPSRGMAMTEGTINDTPVQLPLEPDGKGSHWFRFDKSMRESAGAKEGDTVTLEIEPMDDWPEPKVPPDLKKALAAANKSKKTWKETTPKARWEWIRWIRSTNNPETRKRRIDVAMSKLGKGSKRPCCFNASMCTEPRVSKSGVLLEPT